MDKRPAFFKVFMPELCLERMQIPPAFVAAYLRGQRINNATFLRDGKGNAWHVEISIEGRDVFFDKGWVQFVEDNRIDVGDFLVFELSVGHFFDFKHFGRSACEKEKDGSFNFTVKTEDLEGEEEVEEEEEEEMAMNNAYGGEEEDDYNGVEKEEDSGNVKDGVGEECEEENTDEDGGKSVEWEELDDDDDDYDDDEEEEDSEKNDKKDKRKGKEIKQGLLAGPKKKRCRLAKADTMKFEEEIFGSGDVPYPTNPYFVVKIRKDTRQELFVPSELVKINNLILPPMIDIVDEGGRRYQSAIKEWKAKRIVVKKGWRAFRNFNRVKIGDKCLVEFVPDWKNKKTPLYLKVRIFPSA